MLHEGTSLEIAVVQHGSASAPRLEAALSPHRLGSAAKNIAAATLTRLLGLDRDLSDFYTQAAADETLAPLAQRYRGLKPPRFPTVFECLLNAVACQQFSIEAGLTLLNRLAAITHPDRPALPPFPAPAEVAALTPQQLRAAGFSTQKTNTIQALAAATHAGLLDLEALEQADNASASARLLQLRGIGPWSADYVLLRGLGRLSVFPRSDIGALNGLHRLLGTDSADEAVQALSRWAPYAGLVYFHLLLNGLEARRILDVPGSRYSLANAVKTDINKLKGRGRKQ